jgi:hypothetical protein
MFRWILVLVATLVSLAWVAPTSVAHADTLSTCALYGSSAARTVVAGGDTCAEVMYPGSPEITVLGNGGVQDLAPQLGLTFSLSASAIVDLVFSTGGEMDNSGCASPARIPVQLMIELDGTVERSLTDTASPFTVSFDVPVSVGAGSHTLDVFFVQCASGTVTLNTNGNGLTLSAEARIGTSTTTAPMARFHVRHQHQELTCSWSVKTNRAITGFNVYAGTHRLTQHTVATHTSRRYTFETTWKGKGPYLLQMLRSNGSAVMISSK